MKRWPEAWLWWFGAALILAVNAVVLGGAAFNRSGAPQARLALTERELALPYVWRRQRDEDSGLALQLRWRVAQKDGEVSAEAPHRHGSQAPWLDEARLRALGFVLPEPQEAAEWTWRQHRRLRSRSVFLALEHDGDGYRDYLAGMDAWAAKERVKAEAESDPETAKNRLKYIDEQLRDAQERDSRLYVVDADADAAVLRARYADPARFVVLRGRVEPEWLGGRADQGGHYAGRIESLDVDSLHVPAALLPVFDGSGDLREEQRPRYRVDVAWGRRAEPWIETAARLP